MLKKLPIIGVMGASGAAHEAWAAPLGRAIAEHGWHVLTGGGAGTMECVSRAFTAVAPRAGLSIGVLPTAEEAGVFKVMETYPNHFVELPIVTNLGLFDGHDAAQVSRNFINILTSHVVVALPGSKGTRNEVALAQKFGKTIILFGPAEGFTGFPAGPRRTEKLDDVLEYIKKNI